MGTIIFLVILVVMGLIAFFFARKLEQQADADLMRLADAMELSHRAGNAKLAEAHWSFQSAVKHKHKPYFKYD